MLEAGLNKRDGRVVIDSFGVDRLDDANVIGDVRDVRQQLADVCAGLTVLAEFENGFDDREILLAGRHPREPLAHPDRRGQFALMQLFECRFVIQQVHLRRPARHEEVNDAFGSRRKMCLVRNTGAGQQTGVQQRTKCRRPNPGRQPAEKMAAGQQQCIVTKEVHINLWSKTRPGS